MTETIQSLRVRALLVPMAEPHRTASGVITVSPLVLVDLQTASGVVGHSMVFTYNTPSLKPTAQLIEDMQPWVQGQPLAPAALCRHLLGKLRLFGTYGITGIAIAAIDMAAWDALARTHGVPLCELLGATPRPTQAYGGIGFDGAKGCAGQAERWARRGFRAVKAKIGYPAVDEDVAVIRAMRSAVGPDVAIMVDYNQCLSPVAARERMRVLDGEGLAWVEEPVIAEDYAGMAAVAREAATPTPTAHWLEYADWWNPVLAEPLEVREGMAIPSNRPGSGVEWNEAAIARLVS